MTPPLEIPLDALFDSIGGRRRAYLIRSPDGTLTPSEAGLELVAQAVAEVAPDYDEHEAIFIERGPKTGAIFGAFLHRTVRGQGAGGVRHWPYATVASFVADGLRLSRGMGRKNALAGLWWGGGKGIIARVPGDRHRDPEFRAELYREYGRFISSLHGVYVTAEDVGTGPSDMACVFETTRFTTCIPPALGGSGNPSSWTALGVVSAMEAALDHAGSGTLAGKHVAMQGAGNVASFMIDALIERGVGHVTATDIDDDACNRARARYPADRVTVTHAEAGDTSIFETPCDVFAPNALGGVLDRTTIARLKTRLVCGAANNVLMDEDRDAAALVDRGITFVPDFLANRMGIVNCANEQYGTLDPDPAVMRHLGRDWTHSIYQTTRRVLEHARDHRVTPMQAASSIADELGAEPHPIFGHRTRAIYDYLIASEWHRGGAGPEPSKA